MDGLLSTIGLCLLILFFVALCSPRTIGETGREVSCAFYGTCTTP